MSSDGKIYVADPANGRPVHFFAISDSAIDEAVRYIYEGEVEYEETTFTIGSTLFLSVLSNDMNISQDVPTIIAGRLFQRLGIAISRTTLKLQIESPRLIQ